MSVFFRNLTCSKAHTKQILQTRILLFLPAHILSLLFEIVRNSSCLRCCCWQYMEGGMCNEVMWKSGLPYMWQGNKCECILIIIPIDITSKKDICIKSKWFARKIHAHTNADIYLLEYNYFTITEFIKEHIMLLLWFCDLINSQQQSSLESLEKLA